jgi:hypothetical protein
MVERMRTARFLPRLVPRLMLGLSGLVLVAGGIVHYVATGLVTDMLSAGPIAPLVRAAWAGAAPLIAAPGLLFMWQAWKAGVALPAVVLAALGPLLAGIVVLLEAGSGSIQGWLLAGAGALAIWGSLLDPQPAVARRDAKR